MSRGLSLIVILLCCFMFIDDAYSQKGRSSSASATARIPDMRPPPQREIYGAAQATHDDSHFIEATRLVFTDAVKRHEEVKWPDTTFKSTINYELYNPKPIYP